MGWALDREEDILLQIRAMGVAEPVVQAIGTLIRNHKLPGAERELAARQSRGEVLSTPNDVAELASEFHRRALKRADLLGDLASDLAWQMLLALVADENGGSTVSSLCHASGGPMTTALRHIAAMEKRGLIERFGDARDGRRVWIRMTDSCREHMQTMLIGFCVPLPRHQPERRPSVFE